MSKFKFRLATLLRLREAARDERRARIGRGLPRRRRPARARLEALDAELQSLRDRRRASVEPGEVDVDRLVESNATKSRC